MQEAQRGRSQERTDSRGEAAPVSPGCPCVTPGTVRSEAAQPTPPPLLGSQLSLRHHTLSKKVLSYLNQPESMSVAGGSELGNVPTTSEV